MEELYAIKIVLRKVFNQSKTVAEGYKEIMSVLDCKTCKDYAGKMHPSHLGSENCESGSIASGGNKTHCTCDVCF